MQYFLFGTWLLFGIAAKIVSGYSAGAESGDFLLSTASYAAFLDPKQDVNDTGTRQGIAAVSPSGSVRFAVEFNISYTRTPLQTSVSPDGKYAFTTVTTLDAGKEMGIYVTRIKGSNPKVIQTITVPPKKYCSYPNQNSELNAPIAVGSGSSGDNYVIYVVRECDERNKNKKSQRFSIEVLKLRYSLSTGNVTILNENVKPYFRDGLNKSPTFSAFRTLQVINGKPYGLLYGGSKTIKVLRLEGSKIPTLASSSPKFRDCIPVRFSIASPKHFYGICFPKGEKYLNELVSVDGNQITWGPPNSEGPPNSDWEGTVAVDQKTSNQYIFVRDASGLTLYKLDGTKFQAPPNPVFKLAPILVSNPIKNQGNVEIKELFVVP